MDTLAKKRLHHFWTFFRAVKPAYLLVVLVLLGTGTVFALRYNNQTMVQLRQAVYEADEQNGDVEGALRELREFVYGHMNTDLSSGPNAVHPPIQLKATYERLVAAEQDRLKEVNESIYTDAQAYCERLHPESFSGGPRVPCIQEYVTANGVESKPIPDGLYKFDFVSPRWSPDAAGLGLVATVFVAVILIVRLITPRILKLLGVI